MKFKAELEQILTSEVRKKKPEISHVSVSFDEQFAIYNEDARYTLRRLSAAAKHFLDTGDPESIKQHGLFM